MEDDGNGLKSLQSIGNNDFSFNAKYARENFLQYLNNHEAALPWQQIFVKRGGEKNYNICKVNNAV